MVELKPSSALDTMGLATTSKTSSCDAAMGKTRSNLKRYLGWARERIGGEEGVEGRDRRGVSWSSFPFLATRDTTVGPARSSRSTHSRPAAVVGETLQNALVEAPSLAAHALPVIFEVEPGRDAGSTGVEKSRRDATHNTTVTISKTSQKANSPSRGLLGRADPQEDLDAL